MRRFYSILIGILCVSGMAGCDVKGALDSSGRLVGSKDTGKRVELDRYRVSISEVYVSRYTARRNPTPLTYRFGFSWSPAEVARIHRSKGYRQPSETDWANYRSLAASLLSSASEKSARITNSLVEKQRAAAEASDYEHVVWPNGAIGSCISASSVNKWCGPGPRPSRAEQRRLAQIALDRVKPGCRVGRTDPKEVAAVALDSQLSWDRSLVVEVLCSRK